MAHQLISTWPQALRINQAGAADLTHRPESRQASLMKVTSPTLPVSSPKQVAFCTNVTSPQLFVNEVSIKTRQT